MESPCPQKELCGSCSWSHLPYEEQLAQKLAAINQGFAGNGVEIRCEKIIASPKQLHYRNRMDFVIDYQGKVGLRQKGAWWKVIDGHPCVISDEAIESAFHIVRGWTAEAGLSFFCRKKHTGLLRYAVIRATSTGERVVIILTSKPQDEAEEALLREALKNLGTRLPDASILWSINFEQGDTSVGSEWFVIQGKETLLENIRGTEFEISPHAFFQTNSLGAGLLLDTVLEYVEQAAPREVLDLYCGSGFFSIPLARAGKKVRGVELVKEAIDDAKRNAARNNVEVEFFAEKAEDFLWDPKPDVLIVDPPRAGLHPKALQKLMQLDVPEIVYVSCNPAQFAREMKVIGEKYRVVDSRAIDMFPHTPHVELVTRLRVGDVSQLP